MFKKILVAILLVSLVGTGAFFYLGTKSKSDEALRQASNAALKFGLYVAAYPIIKTGDLSASSPTLDSGVRGVSVSLNPLQNGDLCFIAKATDSTLKPGQPNFIFYYEPDDKNPRISFAMPGVTKCSDASNSLMRVSTSGDQMGLVSLFNMMDGKRLTPAGESAWTNFKASGNVFQQRESELRLLELKTDLYNLGAFLIKYFINTSLTPVGLPEKVESDGYELWGGSSSYFLQPGTVIQLKVLDKAFCVSRGGLYLNQTLTEAASGSCPINS